MLLTAIQSKLNRQRIRSLLATGLVYLSGCLATAMAGPVTSAHTLADIAREYGEYAIRRIDHWQYIINSGKRLSEREKLATVNAFINELKFANDIDHWGVEDYWATPLETLASNAGDCEDFSIAKYFTLLQMGIPAERMRLTYVKAVELNQAHMVLTYYETPGSEPLILDNLKEEIEPASKRGDLLPVYSFNVDGLWLAKAKGLQQHVGSPTQLSKWNSVMARISDERGSVLR